MSKDTDAHYFHKGEKRYPPARLNFSVGLDKKPKAMNLFCLLYPSQFLADCYNPIDCLNRGLSLREIEAEISTKIKEKVGYEGINIYQIKNDISYNQSDDF